MIKPGLLEVLSSAHEEEQAFLASLSGEERVAGSSAGRWSARDLLTHLAVWKMRLARSLAALIRGEDPAQYDDLTAENAAIFDENRGVLWPALAEWLTQGQDELVKQTQALTDDILYDTRRFAWQNGQPYWRLIVMDGYWHPTLHLSAFYYERGEPGRLNERVESSTARLRGLDRSISWQGKMLYDLACYYALTRQSATAVARLREALRHDPALTEWSQTDSDLSPIRDDPGYAALYRK
jgi:hypothetical protein